MSPSKVLYTCGKRLFLHGLALEKGNGSVQRVHRFKSSVNADTVGAAKGRHEVISWQALELYRVALGYLVATAGAKGLSLGQRANSG